MTEDEAKQAQEFWKGFAEAPYSDSYKWVDGAGFEHLTTVRAWSGPELYNSAARSIALILETGGEPIRTVKPMPQTAMPPTPSKPVQQAMADGDNETAATIQAAIEDIGAPPAGKQWKTFDAVVVEILPQPDDRVNINFFGNEHKQPHDEFPGVKVTKWKLDSAANLLKHVATVDVSKPAKLSLACRVFYTDGKEYTKTNGDKGNYKDIAHVRLMP